MSDYDGVEGHRLWISRYVAGMTPIRPTRPLYGTSGGCSCRQWRSRFNGAPSKGGRAAMREQHKKHVEEENS